MEIPMTIFGGATGQLVLETGVIVLFGVLAIQETGRTRLISIFGLIGGIAFLLESIVSEPAVSWGLILISGVLFVLAVGLYLKDWQRSQIVRN